jgi:uncharacterized protein
MNFLEKIIKLMCRDDKLNIRERIVSSLLYAIIIIGIGKYLNGDFSFLFDSSNKFYLLFAASSMMLIMGDYLTEPYYTKPVDVIVKSFTILLVLGSVPVEKQQIFILYDIFLYINIFLLILSCSLVLWGNQDNNTKLKKFFLGIITKFSSPSIIFSILYLLSLFSFFESHSNDFFILFGLWLLLIFKKPVEFIAKFITTIWNFVKKEDEDFSIGVAIGCDNPFLYKVEIENESHQKNNIKKGELVYLELQDDIGLVGMIFNEKHLLNKKWLSIYILEDNDNNPLKINIKTNDFLENNNTIYSKKNLVYSFDISSLSSEKLEFIESNDMYKNRANFIGYVSENSDINKINFHMLIDYNNEKHTAIGEGTILSCKIFNKNTLFQVLNGLTNEEKLEKYDNHGYTTVSAKKIGAFNATTNKLSAIKWFPNIYSPVFLLDDNMDNYDYLKFIGKLPGTNCGIPITNYDALITHNTAILGILGIGKSKLTFELLKKVEANTDAKIICIDITNEYARENGLFKYIEQNKIKYDDENAFNGINPTFETIASTEKDSGNLKLYKEELKKDLCNFLFNQDTFTSKSIFSDNKKVRIYNIDYHKVSKGKKEYSKILIEALTLPEKTKIITEELFKIVSTLPMSEKQKSKVLLVFEEAHSLVPEDRTNASLGTAKYILQSRKYGLGSLVITQRTANVTKSILSQCNTIFGMKVFDSSGKEFLENFIGKDYADNLALLEDRHAVVTGKAMGLKQPVIITLNDMEKVTE